MKSSELNPEQQRAVETTEGPLLILAGAGSGKTKTLTYRIAHILAKRLATPYEILAVTFTNKAAKEMRVRVAELTGDNPESRSFMPFLGTFHGICVRLLRQNGDSAGVDKNFVIYDEADRLNLIKQIMASEHIDDKQSPPRAIAAIISGAKNELLSPAEFGGSASGPVQKVAAKLFPLYERELRRASALDFDDLIGKTVDMLSIDAEVQKKWQEQFKYILIDEYQDTNAAQYKLIKLLTNKHNNLCVVGDDWQCLLPGSLVETKSGQKKIEDVKQQELVRTASGYGRTGFFEVTKQRKYQYNGDIISIKTASGKVLECTPNHLLFSRFDKTDQYFVYLMYAWDKGYRIGLAKGTRTDGEKDDIGLRVRANQERADKMWVIKVCDSLKEALFNEALHAYKYGIPMLVFRAYDNRSMMLEQSHIDIIYNEINTEERAQKLFSDLGLLFEYPHFMPQATVRNGRKRININVVLFGERRFSDGNPWSASRLSVNTTDKSDLLVFEKLGHRVRSGRADTYRSEVHNLDYGQIEQCLAIIELDLPKNTNISVNKYAFLTSKKYIFMPSGGIHVGMVVPRIDGDSIVDDKVVSVSTKYYKGPVYDLDIDKVHNYLASGLVVHNSIYSWRGADYRNILNFERDYPKATIIKLEQNYRSTQAILETAHRVISKNSSRSDKKLWTAKGGGAPVQVMQAASERGEAEMIIRRVRSQNDMRVREFSDFAVLYRTNAQSRSLEEQFVRFGIPYKIFGGVRFYDRAEIKDIIAYLRLIYQSEDKASFDRIVNTPARGVGKTSLEHFNYWRESENLGISAALARIDDCNDITSKAKAGLMELKNLLSDFRSQSEELPVAEIINALVKRLDYFSYISDGTVQGESRIENVRELLSVAKGYADLGVSGFLEEVALVTDVDSGGNKSGRAVSLMTLHTAKGLEFPVVFMVGMEEGIFPHSRALFDQSEMEEERRLAYVGMTRAKEELILTYATSRALYGSLQHNMPSQFLADVEVVASSPLLNSEEQIFSSPDQPHYAPDLNVGDSVRHNVFGIGAVLEINGDVATIHFKEKGVKKLNIGFAPIVKLDDDTTI